MRNNLVWLAKKASTMVLCTAILATMAVGSTGCTKDTSSGEVVKPISSVIVINEGNWGASNADITVYDLVERVAQHNLFATANNGAAMGDSPAGVAVYNGTMLLSLSGSGKIYGIDTTDFTLVSKITELDSPRGILIESATRGYISNLYANRIDVFNPTTMELTGAIDLGGSSYVGAEGMVLHGGSLYACQWSYGTEVLKINPTSGEVIQRLEVGIQPTGIAMDKNGQLWVMCDGGGWESNPVGYENPSISRIAIDALTGMMTIAEKFELPNHGGYHQKMIMGKDGDRLYFLNDGLFEMSVSAVEVPSEPLVYITRTQFYNLAQNPLNGELYLSAPAEDYVSDGTVYRYSTDGNIIEKFTAGVNPSIIVL